MKKSNKLALGLCCILIVFYVANMMHHNYMFDKNIHSFDPKNVYDTQESRIKVVKIIDPNLQATNKFLIYKKEKWERIFSTYAMEDELQMDAFFKSMVYSNDTLIVEVSRVPIRYPNSRKAEIKLTMSNVEKVLYNNKVITMF